MLLLKKRATMKDTPSIHTTLIISEKGKTDLVENSADKAVSAQQPPIERPKPHGEKLYKLKTNQKLPKADIKKVEWIIQEYENWIDSMRNLTSKGDDKVRDLVKLLNEYKTKVELNLIWDSNEDFLYRQKGQLKLDNSVLEEWFPWLVDIDIFPDLKTQDLQVGPSKAFASVYFRSLLTDSDSSPALTVRSKDQDFTIGRKTYIKSSFSRSFERHRSDSETTFIAYIAAELKTNLDKTMFQEATATSHDLKIAAPSSKYFLICEYLDMTPISSAGTDIEEVLILRGKRTSSSERKNYSKSKFRQENREDFIQKLSENPIRESVVLRFVEHIRKTLKTDDNLSNSAERGYF